MTDPVTLSWRDHADPGEEFTVLAEFDDKFGVSAVCLDSYTGGGSPLGLWGGLTLRALYPDGDTDVRKYRAVTDWDGNPTPVEPPSPPLNHLDGVITFGALTIGLLAAACIVFGLPGGLVLCIFSACASYLAYGFTLAKHMDAAPSKNTDKYLVASAGLSWISGGGAFLIVLLHMIYELL